MPTEVPDPNQPSGLPPDPDAEGLIEDCSWAAPQDAAPLESLPPDRREAQ